MRPNHIVPALLAIAAVAVAADPPQISSGAVTVRTVEEGGAYAGFDLIADGKTAAVVRLSSNRLIVARECRAQSGAGEDPSTLRFSGLTARPGTGLSLGGMDSVLVALRPSDRFPEVSFHLTIARFDAAAWKSKVGAEPFHFLAIHLPEAEAWHQRGWLNATPLADRFPLLEDAHVGTPEISGYKYDRSWSYTPPLGAHPVPVIGLWAPKAGRYAGLYFQETRTTGDNSEKDIATGYRWIETKPGARPDECQFAALVYPHGGRGYQDLVFPKGGERIRSRARLVWSTSLPATGDPNRLCWNFSDFPDIPEGLVEVETVPDVSWIPGGIRLGDFQGPPRDGLIGGVEKPFQVPGSKVMSGWTWHNESPTAAAAKHKDTVRIAALEREAEALLKYAKRFSVDGEECVYWEKPLEGRWTDEWGGKPVTTLHNANGFAAGRLFLGLWRDCGKAEYLPVVDGVFNWAKRIAWTRNEFADVPSSPFAIGGTLSASFCLEYWMAFRGAADEAHQKRAAEALDLASSFTYRYLVMWGSDSDRDDGLDPTFLWEPNSGRDWTGAACANEVFWNLDTLAQTAVHTGDWRLRWALAGSLGRWHQLYQEVYREKLADYGPSDMTEGYGLYAGNVYGVGARAAYGFASPLVMCEPVGNSFVRVLAGERAAMAFKKGEEEAKIADYRYSHPGNLSFTVECARSTFDLSLTVPYVDLSEKPVALERGGKRIELKPGEALVRPPQALWSLYLKGIRSGDRVVVGDGATAGGVRPVGPYPESRSAEDHWTPRFFPIGIGPDTAPSRSWERLDSWAGFPFARRWTFGVPFLEPTADERGWASTKPSIVIGPPASHARAIFILYSAGDGPPPAIAYKDGFRDERGPDLEALAWRAWPPIYTARLLAGRFAVNPAKEVKEIDPRGRLVVAATALTADAPVETVRRVDAAFEKGAAAWKLAKAEDARVAGLRALVEKMAPGSLAVLPPGPGGPAMGLAAKTGLLKKAVVLSPEALVDPAAFGAKRFPAALYADGEDYVHTVKAPGDGAEAVIRYVKEGGTLLVLAAGPWPLHYANGPGFHRSEPLTERLGLPIWMPIEAAPAERPTVKVLDQKIVTGAAREFPYPEGDPRLRSIERARIPAGARYTPIATVIGAGGKDLGDAAGLVEFPGGGRILYVSGVLLRDPDNGPAFLSPLFSIGK